LIQISIFVVLMFPVVRVPAEEIKKEVPVFLCEVDFASGNFSAYARPAAKGDRMTFDIDEINKTKIISFGKDKSYIPIYSPLTVTNIVEEKNQLQKLNLVSVLENPSIRLRFDFRFTQESVFKLVILEEIALVSEQVVPNEDEFDIGSVAVLNCTEENNSSNTNNN
jgi:hypothetical protein